MKKKIDILCPFFNESENIKFFFERIFKTLKNLKEYQFNLICVDDGSNDDTYHKLRLTKSIHNNIKLRITRFSRNFGKESVLKYGVDRFGQSDAIIFIDTDLQDPPELIPALIRKWEKSNLHVVARRKNRNYENSLMNIFARFFYIVFNNLAGLKLSALHGDYRLIDKNIVFHIKKLNENQIFMKGIFYWVGFDLSFVEYERSKRINGFSSFSLKSLVLYALNSIISFSIKPLRIILFLGSLLLLFSLFFIIYILYRYFSFGIEAPGYYSIITSILLIGGFNFIALGLIGEYVGRIYDEVKKRPLYIVESEL
jgi:polyisoprenyl-phosphate glycosyltransferase